MDNLHKDWLQYWKNDVFWKNSRIFEINAILFADGIKDIICLNKKDSVLNIGCGIGYLEEILSASVDKIHAIDISDKFIEICKKRCSKCKNITFSTMAGSNYTDLSPYGKAYSMIFCISVVQYYKSMDEVESMIRSAKQIASKEGRLFIADLPVKRALAGFVWDMLSSLLLSIKHGYFIYLARFAFSRWLSNSGYRSFYKNNAQLYFSEKDIRLLITRMKLDARIIKKNLSVYANRLNLLIQF